MRIFSVLIKGNIEKAENVVFVEEKTNFFAGALNFFWCLYHRLWMFAGIILIENIIVAYFKQVYKTSLLYDVIFSLPIFLIFWLFGNDLLIWHLKRRGYKLVTIIAADSENFAKIRFYDKFLAENKIPEIENIWVK